MKFGKRIFGAAFVGYAFISSVALADDIGVGRDNDIPGAQPQPPAETETTTTESTLQQLMEQFGVDAE